MNFHRNSCNKQREKVFFWFCVADPVSGQRTDQEGDRVCLRIFCRFVIVGLGMFARFACYFQTCMKQPYLRFCACALFQPNPNKTKRNKQRAVDVKHWVWNEALQTNRRQLM